MRLATGNVPKSFALENTSEAAEQIVQFANSLNANILIVGKIQTGKTLICNKITDQHFEHKPALPDKPFEFNVNSQQQENGFVALDDTLTYRLSKGWLQRVENAPTEFNNFSSYLHNDEFIG